MKCVWIWMVVMTLVAVNQAVEITLKDAKADGKSDATQAVLKAWTEVCKAPDASKLVIPKGSYVLGPINFEGPCTAPSITIQADGVIFLAPTDPSLFSKQNGWVIFQNIKNLNLIGATFDGQGKTAWEKNNWKGEGCLKGGKCVTLPTTLNFHMVNDSLIKDVTSKDSKNFHMNCVSSSNFTFQSVTISAPGDSPNTDGIHIARGVGIKVLDTTIQTGDDCVSMGDDLKDVLIKNVKCGPGHGISIGSLGKSVEEKDVTGVTVEGCTFNNTSNGVRIKTWPSAPGTLKVTDLNFIDLTMNNASNPVIIDQQYCPWNLCNMGKASLVQISKVKIANIKGTSGSQEVLIFSCSTAKPCQDVTIGNVDLKFTGDPKLGGPVTRCQNVKYTTTGTQSPKLCEKVYVDPKNGGLKPDAGAKPK